MNSPSTEDLVSLIFTVTRLVKEKTVMAGKINPLSIVQLKILSVVSKHEAPTMKDIADSLFITSPSATVAINHLVKDGQLERVPDRIDRRVIHLKMTAKGKKVFVKCRREVLQKISEVLEKLNNRERLELAKVFSKIIDSYKK